MSLPTSPDEPLAGGFPITSTSPEEAQQRDAATASLPALTVRQERNFIHFVDGKMLDISRMYKNRAVLDESDAVAGHALDQLLREVQSLLTLISQLPPASAVIAVPYLLTMLDMTTEYVRVFDQSPSNTFALLDNLDGFFQQLLLQGSVNVTEQTRLNALIGRLRDSVYTKYKDDESYEAQTSKVFEKSLELI